jgi:mRNA-degrading endonuclease RelE of RelBE toxin-antitoxin system
MYTIVYAAGVADDLKGLRVARRAEILDKIDEQLTHEPARSTRNKKLVEGLTPPWDQEGPVWELRIGDYRVFYEIDEAGQRVAVRAIRRKPPHKTTEEIL